MDFSGNGVVYKLEEEDYDSDIWDDTALIKAYDAAVRRMKMEKNSVVITASEGEQSQQSSSKDNTTTTTTTRSNTHRKNHNRKKRNKKKSKGSGQTHKWKTGDQCLALYPDDGQYYDAVILFVNTEDNTCVVRYEEYGNENEVNLNEIQSCHPVGDRDTNSQTNMFYNGCGPWYSPHHVGTPPHPRHRPWGPPHVPHPHTPSFYDSPHYVRHHQPHYIPQTHPGSMFSHVPPPFSHPFSGLPGCVPGSHPLPNVPPPPPVSGELLEEGDEDAMNSMLMSWYMSGYHTGYYMGLKQAQRSDDTESETNVQTSRRCAPCNKKDNHSITEDTEMDGLM